jgi:hypothetical protein
MSRRDKPPLAAGGAQRERPSQVKSSEDRVEASDPPEPPPTTTSSAGIVGAVPGLARIAVAAGWKTAGWAVGSSIQAGGRVVRAARDGESPGELFELTGRELRAYVRGLLEIVEPEPREPEPPPTQDVGRANGSVESLREQGAELLRRSADVTDEEETHPAYERILQALAPDEGRILRLLATRGAQASVDVRTARPLDIGSELIAPGLSMIGAEAGVRHGDNVPSYLNNLYRLGLLWFSREALDDQGPYQVLEAQPEVAEAMAEGGRTKTVRRSIHLTPFGEDFCETVLPLGTEELEALPHDVGPPPQPDVNDEGPAP